MKKLYLFRTNFEETLEKGVSPPLSQIDPLSKELQFLPFLFADEEDGVVISEMPDPVFFENLKAFRGAYPVPILESRIKSRYAEKLATWAWSASADLLAKTRSIAYPTMDINLLKCIHGKSSLFHFNQAFPGSFLAKNATEALEFLRKQRSRMLLKKCFSFSGKGHFDFLPESDLEPLIHYLAAAFANHHPVLIEPYLERIFDFSSQWEINERGEVSLLGSTVCENSGSGVYNGTLVGDERSLFKNFAKEKEQHLTHAAPLIKRIADAGYVGYLGVDAFIYKTDKGICLRPLVEINARATMGLVALLMQQKFFPKNTLRFSLKSADKSDKSLLPLKLPSHRFSKRICVDLL